MRANNKGEGGEWGWQCCLDVGQRGNQGSSRKKGSGDGAGNAAKDEKGMGLTTNVRLMVPSFLIITTAPSQEGVRVQVGGSTTFLIITTGPSQGQVYVQMGGGALLYYHHILLLASFY